jgi:hypothetical protein
MTDEGDNPNAPVERQSVERIERALEHDIEVLEDKAVTASKRLAARAAPVLVAVLVLLVLAWLAGRRLRDR